ncbi:MAG TPA: DUF1622 domain-containing protein [Sphingomicrobium sp.]
MDQLFTEVVPFVVRAIELVGVTIIATGALVTLGQFLFAAIRGPDVEAAVICLRANLGRAILVGLEFLVAADIIHTVLVELTLQTVTALAGIVIIRTLLSFSLEAEIEGQWPWQRGKRQRDADGRQSEA